MDENAQNMEVNEAKVEDAPTKRPFAVSRKLVLGAITICALAGVAHLVNTNRSFPLPNVKELSITQASKTLHDAHLEPQIFHASSDSVRAGSLIYQSPAAETPMKRGAIVNLTYSTGPLMVQVPDITDTALYSASTRLRAHNLTVGKVTKMPSIQDLNMVIEMNPGPAELVRHDSVVTLTVSGGHYGPCSDDYPGFPISSKYYDSSNPTYQGYEAGIIDFLNNVYVGDQSHPQRSEKDDDLQSTISYTFTKAYVGAWKMDNGLASTNSGVIDQRTWNAMRNSCH